MADPHPPYRACGECAACCVWLGIEPLRKWPGQACKHLDGTIPDKRCKVYDKRPECCVTYSCGWRSGLGLEDGFRPDQCGVLTTLHDEPATGVTATVHVFDLALAGELEDPDSKLAQILGTLLTICDDVRVARGGERAGAPIIHFYKGAIYRGVVLPPEKGKFEDMNFAEEQEPIAHYHTRAIDDLTAEEAARVDTIRRQLKAGR